MHNVSIDRDLCKAFLNLRFKWSVRSNRYIKGLIKIFKGKLSFKALMSPHIQASKLNSARDLKLLCADDEQSRTCWVTAMRLFKVRTDSVRFVSIVSLSDSGPAESSAWGYVLKCTSDTKKCNNKAARSQSFCVRFDDFCRHKWLSNIISFVHIMHMHF